MSQQIEQAIEYAKLPAALHKAQSLANFARYQGGGLAAFEVTLTNDEAFELLDWIPTYSGMVSIEGLPMYKQDAAQARRANDPWIVLQNFTFYGLRTTPATVLS